MAEDREEGYRRVVLVGFMGSGKTTVGRILARRLGWELLDFDRILEERTGLTIAEIFRERGEPAFREMEARLGNELLRREEAVLAPGGGWPAAPGRMDALPPATLSVWLRVGVEEALRRARNEGPTRPLLDTPEPQRRARALLGARKAWYGAARLVLDTEGRSPEELAERIARHPGMPEDPASRPNHHSGSESEGIR